MEQQIIKIFDEIIYEFQLNIYLQLFLLFTNILLIISYQKQKTFFNKVYSIQFSQFYITMLRTLIIFFFHAFLFKQAISYIYKIRQQSKMSNQNQDHEDQHFDDDEDGLHPHKPSYDEEHEQTPQQKLEHVIMEYVEKQLEKNHEDSISQQVEDKLKELLEKLPKKNQQQILTIRMHELALSKILVFTHGKSDFRLVKAHHHIGQAYLNYKCYEQAIDHLTVALKKNSKLAEIKQTKLYHSYMLTTLSRCYYEINSYDDALQVLTRAHQIQQTCAQNDKQINNVETLKLMSQCYLKSKNIQKALDNINSALDQISKIKGDQSKQYAFANVLKSKIHIEAKDLLKGIQGIKQSIKILNSINYQNKDEIANLYETLSAYYKSFGDQDNEIDALRKKYDVLEELYGYSDKKALNAKRNVAMTLLKREKYSEAINQLEQILEVEGKVYGDTSTQVGKTLKILGQVHLKTKSNKCQQYLKQAQKILHEQGHPKLVKEIKLKLSLLKQLKQGSDNQAR